MRKSICSISLAFLFFVGAVHADTEQAPALFTIEQKLEKTRALMQATPQAGIQKVPEGDMVAASGMKMLQGLGVLIALLVGGAWVYKRYILKDTPVITRKMKLLERIPLAPRASLLLAEIEGEKILVGLTPESISMMPLTKNTIKREGSPIELTEEYEKM